MGRPAKFTPGDKRKFWSAIAEGYNQRQAADIVGCSPRTAQSWYHDLSSEGTKYKIEVIEKTLPDVLPDTKLGPEALKGRDDFEFFRSYYLGHVSTPWQIDTALTLVAFLTSPDKEWVVLNMPPGVGKSTLIHDLVCWAIVRDRSVRIILGSRTQRQAEKYSMRVRRSLERLTPYLPPSELVAKNLAVDAKGVLARDYGRFKPTVNDLWRVEEFVVAQPGDTTLEDKEPTVAAYGMDSGFLGNRGDMVLWDDLVDRKTLKTLEAIETQRLWWDTEAETRLEPGGLLALLGQRMGPEDLYRYCIDMPAVPDDEEEDDAPVEGARKYRHIVYAAHDEKKCKGVHKPSVAPAWPLGCLLDPRRLPWRELASKAKHREEAYRVQYQQEDVDPSSVTVPLVYVNGGVDPETGAQLPGCWDGQRSLGEIPQGLVGGLISVATADPSPTKFWAVEWWLYHAQSKQRFLIDILRQSMDAPDFLDWNNNAGVFSGVMEEWQIRSKNSGVPITTWVVEANCAQRYLLQYDHVHRWQRHHRVQIIAHQTHINKTNDTYGVTMLKNVYRHGQVRLPGKLGSRNVVLKLVDEATHHPHGSYDDCLMAQWFLEYNLPRLERRDNAEADELPWRPSWSAGEVAYA